MVLDTQQRISTIVHASTVQDPFHTSTVQELLHASTTQESFYQVCYSNILRLRLILEAIQRPCHLKINQQPCRMPCHHTVIMFLKNPKYPYFGLVFYFLCPLHLPVFLPSKKKKKSKIQHAFLVALLLTYLQKKKMKFLPSIKKQMQKKFSEGEVAAQLHRVKSWSRSMNSLCLQIRGNKM